VGALQVNGAIIKPFKLKELSFNLKEFYMRILIVDDNELSRLSIKSELDRSYSVREATNLNDATKLLKQVPFDLCFIDLNLSETEELQGLQLIPLAVELGVYPVVMSSYEADEVIRKAYDLGCEDYYSKGNEKAKIEETIRRYYDSKHGADKDMASRLFPTENPVQRKHIENMVPIVKTKTPVMFIAPTGSGKSYLAERVHAESKRTGAFIALNCGAVSPELMESELFGYGKGAFTGATEAKAGKLLLAHKGTLLLDEVNSMPLALQVKLLTALDKGKFYPVNSDKEVEVDVRIISAGHENIYDMVQKGTFRKDLFHRLAGYTAVLLPLCERKEDLMPLIKDVTTSTRRIAFSDEAKKLIYDYSWPGNVRQIRLFAQVLSTISKGIVSKEQVEECITKSSASSGTTSIVSHEQLFLIRKVGMKEFIKMFKDEAIRLEMERHEGNGKATATIKSLQITESDFYRIAKRSGVVKSRKLGIGIPSVDMEVAYEVQ
jgi:two-component system, NtrC family, response regulator AtoC